MEKAATFRFHGNLNDFLANHHRNEAIEVSFNGRPSVKDVIESLGVPHVEVDEIRVNGIVLQSKSLLPDRCWVEAFPIQQPVSGNNEHRFVVDVHLGKLAKALRILGFDTYYRNDLNSKEIVSLAQYEHRIVLTRSIPLLKHKLIEYGYWLRSEYPSVQLEEVILRFGLEQECKPFRRCLECNGIIRAVPKGNIIHLLEPRTVRYFNEFFQCSNCGKVYWKGSHFDRMQGLIKMSGSNP